MSKNASATLYLRVSADDVTLVRAAEGAPSLHRHRLNRRVSFTLNLREALATAPAALTQQVERVEALCASPFSLVPLSEFAEADAAALYGASFRPQPRSRVLFDTLPALGYALLYALPEANCRALEEAFPHIALRNALTPVLLRAGATLLGTQGFLQTYVHEDATDVALWAGRQLIAANTFATRHVEDAVFFILGFVGALGRKPEELRFLVGGEGRKREALQTALARFAPDTVTLESQHAALPYDVDCALNR